MTIAEFALTLWLGFALGCVFWALVVRALEDWRRAALEDWGD
jgi:hypothetical protein